MPLTSHQQEILDRYLTLPSCEAALALQQLDALEEFEFENQALVGLLEENDIDEKELAALVALPENVADLIATLVEFDLASPEELHSFLSAAWVFTQHAPERFLTTEHDK